MDRQRVGVRAVERAGWKHSGRQGVTLLEVMIALLVLAFGLLAVASMITIMINANSISNRLSIATTLAEDKLETLTTLDYYAIASEAAAPVTGESWATREVTVTPDDPMPNMKKIDVTVSWTGRTRSHNVTVTAYQGL